MCRKMRVEQNRALSIATSPLPKVLNKQSILGQVLTIRKWRKSPMVALCMRCKNQPRALLWSWPSQPRPKSRPRRQLQDGEDFMYFNIERFLLRCSNLVSVLILAFVLPQIASAADDDDPPGRVARLSYARGAVSFNPAGTDDWTSAVLTRPLTIGDKLWTDNGARAELNLGTAAIRLGDQTGFSFLNLDDRATQIQMTEGRLNVRVRRLDQDELFEIDTPNLAFSILRPGIYRINVNESGDATMVAVQTGEGEVTGGGSAYTLRARESGMFFGI